MDRTTVMSAERLKKREIRISKVMNSSVIICRRNVISNFQNLVYHCQQKIEVHKNSVVYMYITSIFMRS